MRSSSLSDEEVSAYLYVVIRYLILTIIITSPHLWTVAQKLDIKLTKAQVFMSSPKFSLELRLAAVQHYLSGKIGFDEVAVHFGVGRTALRRWGAAYELHGPDGLPDRLNLYP